MKLLVLDDGSGRLDGIQEVCKPYQLEIVPMDSGALPGFDGYGGILLTAQYRQPGEALETDWPESLDAAIRDTALPVFGIGRGFEIVCAAHGAGLAAEGERGTGADRMEPTADGAKLFQGSDPIRLHETYRWCLDGFPRGWAVLARSETGIEAVRHKTRPVYGLQLYPEDFTYASDGKLVFQNILAAFGKV